MRTVLMGLVGLLLATHVAAAQDGGSAVKDTLQAVKPLESALRATPGCLGVTSAVTETHQYVLFAWFTDKQAVEGWFYGPTHAELMRRYFPPSFFPSGRYDPPLTNVADTNGPLLVVAALTFADRPEIAGSPLAVSQISVEVYAPLEGIAVNGRFSPAAMPMPNLRDYTPKVP